MPGVGLSRLCRICGTSLPPPFFDLGMMPLANAFRATPGDVPEEEKFPLALSSCATCGLVQLTFVVPAPTLYRDYIYVSSTSDEVQVHAHALATKLVKQYGLTSADLVLEIASNDGTALRAFQQIGLPVLGVEPARNVAKMAERAGVPTVAEFFDGGLARTLVEREQRPAIILARHVFAHVDDVHDFLDGVNRLLRDDGVFVIEVPYLGDLLANFEFDTIYHEHLSYFALEHLVRLCEAHGLCVVDVDHISLHGGSIVVSVRKQGADVQRSVPRMLEQEKVADLWSSESLERFTRGTAIWRRDFEGLIESIVRDGGVLVAYGAAAKANTLLNYCPSVAQALVCVLDRSEHKQGRFTPGTHTPVCPVDEWRERGATHMLILAWNFKEEIMGQMQPFAEAGGRFVIPLPVPTVL